MTVNIPLFATCNGGICVLWGARTRSRNERYQRRTGRRRTSGNRHSERAVRLTVLVGDFSRSKINDLELVDQNIASWNQVASWLKQLECLRRTATHLLGDGAPAKAVDSFHMFPKNLTHGLRNPVPCQ